MIAVMDVMRLRGVRRIPSSYALSNLRSSIYVLFVCLGCVTCFCELSYWRRSVAVLCCIRPPLLLIHFILACSIELDHLSTHSSGTTDTSLPSTSLPPAPGVRQQESNERFLQKMKELEDYYFEEIQHEKVKEKKKEAAREDRAMMSIPVTVKHVEGISIDVDDANVAADVSFDCVLARLEEEIVSRDRMDEGEVDALLRDLTSTSTSQEVKTHRTEQRESGKSAGKSSKKMKRRRKKERDGRKGEKEKHSNKKDRTERKSRSKRKEKPSKTHEHTAPSLQPQVEVEVEGDHEEGRENNTGSNANLALDSEVTASYTASDGSDDWQAMVYKEEDSAEERRESVDDPSSMMRSSVGSRRSDSSPSNSRSADAAARVVGQQQAEDEGVRMSVNVHPSIIKRQIEMGWFDRGLRREEEGGKGAEQEDTGEAEEDLDRGEEVVVRDDEEPSPQNPVKAKVLYNYNKRRENELSVTNGEQVKILQVVRLTSNVTDCRN